MAGYVELTLKIRREESQWVGYCEELGTSTCARDIQKVEEALKELVLLHLNTLEEVGVREAFFRKHKIVFHRGKPSSLPRAIAVRPGEYVTRMTAPIPAAA